MGASGRHLSALAAVVLCTACAGPSGAPAALRVQASRRSTPTPEPTATPEPPTAVPAQSAVAALPRTRPAPAPAAPADTGSAIHPENRPSDIAGRENGLLTDADLVTVEGRCRAARAAAPSLWRMLATARAQGVALSPGDCYRPRERQERTRTNSCAKGNCACAGRAGFSMHGWGKAVDLHNPSGAIGFDDPEYRWLKQHAARFGWNHARWAEPGSECPEAWHWEWVGDGGRMQRPPIRADVVSVLPSGAVVDGLGGPPQDRALASVVTAGVDGLLVTVDGATVPSCGSASFSHAVGVAKAKQGCWVADESGQVVALDGAPALGSAPGRVTAMVATPSGAGYWLVTPRGVVHAFGDAAVHGHASQPADLPIAGMAATPSGDGYWLAAADGNVFAFGDAPDLGRTTPPAPVAGIAASGTGFRVAAIDGTVVAR